MYTHVTMLVECGRLEPESAVGKNWAWNWAQSSYEYAVIGQSRVPSDSRFGSAQCGPWCNGDAVSWPGSVSRFVARYDESDALVTLVSTRHRSHSDIPDRLSEISTE